MNSRVLIFFLVLLFPIEKTIAQQVPVTGLLPEDDVEYEQEESIPERGSLVLPIEKNLKKYCPTPGNQGRLPSCVGWALAYALSIERSVRREVTDQATLDKQVLSASFIYNQIKEGDCYKGAKLSSGLKLLMNVGDCPASDFPNSTPCKTVPSKAHKQKAASYTIKRYERVFSQADNPNDKIDAVRYVLHKNQPVLLGIKVPDNFQNAATDNLDWSKVESRHAVVVVGYHDLEQTFLILNSYGPDWGDDGFIQVNYDDLGRAMVYGYRLVLD